MWEKTFNQIYLGVSKESLWTKLLDVETWHEWNPGVRSCTLEGKLEVGSSFILEPISGPKVKIQIAEVEKYRRFVDCTKLLGAKMYGIHELNEEEGEGLRITTTIKVIGPLCYIWVFLIARKIAAKAGIQTERLVALCRKKVG